jgi:hypothetical protein
MVYIYQSYNVSLNRVCMYLVSLSVYIERIMSYQKRLLPSMERVTLGLTEECMLEQLGEQRLTQVTF